MMPLEPMMPMWLAGSLDLQTQVTVYLSFPSATDVSITYIVDKSSDVDS